MHTPGPWAVEFVQYKKPLLPGFALAIIRDQNDHGVAFLGRGKIPESEEIANAHLIAAAPEMLAALEAILFEIQSDPLAVRFFDLRLIKKAEDAVKKARGE